MPCGRSRRCSRRRARPESLSHRRPPRGLAATWRLRRRWLRHKHQRPTLDPTETPLGQREKALEVPGARPGPDPASAQRPVRGRRGVGGSAQALASERNPTSHGASPGASQTRPGTQVGCRVCAASWPRCPGTAAAGEASPGSVGGAVPNPVLPSRAQPQGQCCYFSV